MREPSRDHSRSLSENRPVVTCFALGGAARLAGTATVQMWDGRSKSAYPAPLLRYAARVMTRTSLGSSAFGSLLSKSLASVVERKAMLAPSGDQTGAAAPLGRSVSGRGSPPCIDRR